jgi:hypothetical protein
VMYSRRFGMFTLKQLLAGGAGLLAIGLLLDSRSLPSFGSKTSEACQAIAKTETTLSGEQIAKLLTVQQGAAKSKVRSILKEPYCKLSAAQVRAGTPSEREVYLVDADDFVDFKPKTQLVVLYEGDQYEGYRFWAR